MANDFDTTNPARRLEDHRPAAQLDWGKPDAPAVPKSTTAGAARQGGNTGLEGLARYTEVAEYTGDELVIPDPRGEYVKFKDVERLFASIPPLTAPVPLTKALADDDRYQHVRDLLLDSVTVANKDRLHQALDLLSDLAAASEAAPAPQQSEKHLPGWERGIATVTLSGHQLRMALDLINPDGPSDDIQMGDELTFGIVQHKDDEGKATTGMCCWNGDTDGVLPLDGEYEAEAEPAPQQSDLSDDQIMDIAEPFHDINGVKFDEVAFARALLGRAKATPAAPVQTAWLPMPSAPKDGTMVRLLVEFTENATEDSAEPCPTIGANNFDNDEQDEWKFAGWNWSHDCFTEGVGTPVGWLPLIDNASSVAAPVHAALEQAQWISVDERQPENDTEVVVRYWPYNNHQNRQAIGYARYYDGCFYDEDMNPHHPPSHWMLMPEITRTPSTPEASEQQGGQQ
jgi:hypothetical protein